MSKDKQADRFTLGYLCACQNLAISYMEDSTASDLLRESNIPKQEFLDAQKGSGYENKKMKQIINEAYQ